MTRRELLTALAAMSSLMPAGCDATEAPPLGSLRDFAFERIDLAIRESMEAYHGRIVLLNVWALWCPPCRAEMPALQRLADRLPADRFAVLGLSVDDDPRSVREFLRRLDVRFARHIDPRAGILRTAVPIEAYPLNLVLDAKANVRWMQSGWRDWDAVDGAAWLDLAAAGHA